MSREPATPDLEDFEYNLKCRIVVFNKAFKEKADHGQQHQDYMVALVPRNDFGQYVTFLNAWLPAKRGDEHYNEVIMQMGSPVFAPCRGAVMRDNENVRDHHIFVMSTGVEEMLKQMYKRNPRAEVQITVLPQESEELADDAPSTSRTAR